MSQVTSSIRLVDRWFEQNHIDADWLNEQTFFVDGVRYLYLRHKDGKVFSPDFTFIVEPDELEEFMSHDELGKVKEYCFEFGGKVYHSSHSDKAQLQIFKYIGKAKSVSGFDYLGVHGGFELCGGSRPYEAWCDKAKFLQINTLAICEKNTLAGALKFQIACDNSSIKSIIGETITVRGQVDYQVKLYVADDKGWSNLLRIHKAVTVDNEGFIFSQDLIVLGEGLYCVFQHDTMIDESFGDYLDGAFRGIYFQFDTVRYKAVNRDMHCLQCLKNAIDLGFPLALICDSYYLDEEDSRVRAILQFAGNTGFAYQSDDQHFKTLDQVSEQAVEMFASKGQDYAFDILEQAIQGTNEIVSGCDFKIKLGQIRLPKYQLSEKEKENYNDPDDLFWSLIEKGLERKIVSKGKDLDKYTERVAVEYDVISRGGFIDYFLILSDIIQFANDQKILVGLGRGSGVGSLVAYLLDLVKVDPLEYGLLFERFLNEGRIGKSLPDLDSDFAGNRRGEVKRYIEERYGVDNVCSIGTYGTFKLKAAFRDICRFKGVEPQILNYFAKMISESSDELQTLFYDAAETPLLKKFISENSDVINDIDLILGQPKNASIHAAGVVITPSDEGMEIYDYMPIKKIDGILISEWEGPELETAGFLKEDILGIRQLDKFSDIFALIDQNHKEGHPEFEEIDYNDPQVIELFKKGWNQDLFHFGSKGLTAYSQDVKPDSMEELIAMIALYRPGVMEFGAHEDYVKIKRGKKDPHYDWGMEEITKSTHSILIYQEQIMQACQVLGGFNLTQADDIRKAMGKKILEKLQGYKSKFIEGAVLKGCPEYEANQIWSKLEAFAGYGFNKCISGNERLHRIGLNKSGKSVFNPTIGEMYKIYNDYSYAKSIGKVALYTRYHHKGFGYGFSLNNEGRLIKNKIKEIRYAGQRLTHKIQLESGKTICVTDNHKFPTLEGDRLTSNLKVGDYLCTNQGYDQLDSTYYKMGRMKVGQKGLLTGWEAIESIKPHQQEDVYDIEMEAPYHTFATQQGIVTCNSHAAAYAMTGYFCQYLKYYYPMEFWTVSLQYAKEEEIPERISEIRKFKNITVLPPDINMSQQTFTSDFSTNTIYWSLGKIKFAGDAAVGAIIEERNKNGQFFDIEEFVSRVDKRKVNKRVVTNLILAGCFDALYKVEVPYQRREILRQFMKEEFLEEYNTTDLFFWFVKQKEVSQSGYFDYSEPIANSDIPFAPQRYLTPDRILVMDNIDKSVVVAGLLMDVIVRKSKKGPFAQLILDHNNETVEVTVWNDSWVKFSKQLQNSIHRGVIVSGKVVGPNRHKKYNVIHSFDDTVIEIF